jgi:hypothetical protein
MNQYLLSVHGVDGEPPPPKEVMMKMYADVAAFNEVLHEKGAWIFGGGLRETSTAKVVRVKEGKKHFTDGPFVEAKEHIGGFWIIKAKDMEAALDWASQASVACQAPVEVRPFQEPAP